MTEEIKDIIEEIKVEPLEIIDKTPKEPTKNPTSKDTESPYDSMDNTDEEILAFQEDINAQ